MKVKNMFRQAMSAFLAVLVILTVAVGLPLGAFAEANGTWGASDDGIYYISTPADMLAFAAEVNADTTETPHFAGETVKLTANISMEGTEWQPIPDFAGIFDGGGHSIKYLNVTADAENVGALFGTLTSGTVKNLCLIGGEVMGKNVVGGIVGQVTGNCVFENIYVKTTVKTTTASNCGGLVGRALKNAELRVTSCVSHSTVESKANGAGGLIGYTDQGSSTVLTDCAFLGSCKGTAWSAGIIGYARGNAVLTRCVDLGTVTAGTSAAGLVAMYSDRAISWNPANEALTADPNADISQYVSKIHFADCYSAAPYAIYRHSNRYFRCIELSVSNGGTEVDLSCEANGFTTDNPYTDTNAASKPFSDAVLKIDRENFDFESCIYLTGWTELEEHLILPQTVADLLESAGISTKPIWELAVNEGAAVRMTEQAAIRFTSSFSKEYYQAVAEEYGEENISFGTLIVESVYVAKEVAVSFEMLYLMSIPYTDAPAVLRQTEDGSYYFYGVAEVDEEHYGTEYAALAYIKVKKGGRETCTFTAFREETVRSVNQIAKMAADDVQPISGEGYSNAIVAGDTTVYSPYGKDEYQLIRQMLPKSDAEEQKGAGE